MTKIFRGNDKLHFRNKSFLEDCCTKPSPLFLNNIKRGGRSFLLVCCNPFTESGVTIPPNLIPPPNVQCGLPQLRIAGNLTAPSPPAYSLGVFNPAAQGNIFDIISAGAGQFTNTSTEPITFTQVSVTSPVYVIPFTNTLPLGTVIAVSGTSPTFGLSVDISNLPTGFHKINVLYKFSSPNCPNMDVPLEFTIQISACANPPLFENLTFSSAEFPPTLPYVLSQNLSAPNINNGYSNIKVTFPDVTQGVNTDLDLFLEYDNNDAYSHVITSITQVQQPGFGVLPSGISFAVIGTFPNTITSGSSASGIGASISLDDTVPVGLYDVCIQVVYQVCGSTETLQLVATFRVV